MKNPTKNSEQGFTLIELLIAMAIALVVIATLSNAFTFSRKTYNLQEQIAEMTQSARAALDMISREVKMAGYDPTRTLTLGTTVGVPYSSSQLEIRADLNGDGDTSDSHEIIIYTEDSTNKQIDRATGGGSSQPFAENIESFSFQYYDEDGNATTTSSDIREIEITVESRTANPDPRYSHPVYSDGYRRYTLKSYVTPPNLDL